MGMKEWREIDGFPNYMVSNTGEIKSLNYNKTGKEKVLIPHKLSNGYLGINLYDNDKKSCYLLIHRLVAQAFLPNPNGCRIINHKDENRSNNSVNNLEWCSHKYNLNYGNRNSKLSEKLHNNPLISTPVIQYSIMKELIREFPSLSEAVRHLNCPNRGSAIKNILRSCNSDDATAYGYKWKLKTL